MNLRKKITAALAAGMIALGSSRNLPSSFAHKADKEKGLEHYIQLYIGTDFRKKKFEEALNNLHERRQFYWPIFKEYSEKFRDKGFDLSPADLGYISNAQEIVESFGNTREISHRGAEGNMQFMPKTAEILGLKRNNYINQSFDPFESKEKANQHLFEEASYLRSVGVEDSFNWALLSYNSGMTAVMRLRKKGYWTPLQMNEEDACLETREYLWRNYAVSTILRNMKAYDLHVNTEAISYFEEYTVKRGDSLYSISKKCKVSMEDLIEYNPIKLFNLDGSEIRDYSPMKKEWRWNQVRSKMPVNYVLKIPRKS